MSLASFIAGEAISAGNAVYVGSTGLLYKANALNQTQASVVGVAIESGSSGSLVRVNTDHIYAGYTGLNPGEYRYLSILNSGQLVAYSGWAAELATISVDAYLETVGRAVTTSGLEVEASTPLYVVNPTSVLLLESSVGIGLDAILLEDGSTIDLETASV